MKTLVIIPSRMSATRLPGKPLLKINNLSIISHVSKKAEEASSAFLETCEMIDKLFIFSKGLPGSLVADILEGIITKVFIIFSNYYTH